MSRMGDVGIVCVGDLKWGTYGGLEVILNKQIIFHRFVSKIVASSSSVIEDRNRKYHS